MNNEYEDLTELWHETCDGMLLARRPEVHVSSLTIVAFDQLLRAQSMAYDMDLSHELWLTAGRFTGLQRDYINTAALEEFVDKTMIVSAKRPQIAQMQCRMKGQRHVAYKWGNCILGFSFRRVPEPQLTMYSRTSMITRMGGLDLALAYHIAKEIAEASDEDHTDYQFAWYISNLQHSSLQGVPYFYAHDLHERDYSKKDLEAPALRSMMRQLEYFDRLDAEGRVAKHGTRRRVREQRREFLDGKMDRPHVPVDSLDLMKLKEDS